MGDYKQLNRDLIDANRELKQTIATYQKELTLMRAELMEHHRLRIETERDCRDRMLTFVTKNFKNFLASLQEIDANINLLELLGYDNCVQNGSYNVGVNSQSDNTRSSRRSTQLVKEFRRSSAVCRQHSVLQVSPTRRQNAITEETEAGRVSEQSGSDMDLENSVSEENVIDVENDETGENEELRCIKESEEEYEEEIRMHTSGASPTITRQPIKDLTNLDMEDRQPKANIVTKRGKQYHRRNDSENSIELARNVGQDCTQTPSRYLNEMEEEGNLVTSMHRYLHLSRSASDLRESTEQCDAGKVSPSLYIENFNRPLVVRVQRIHGLSHIAAHFENEEQTITPKAYEHLLQNGKNDELSLGLTEFSMGNFMEASCSTPCHSITAAVVVARAEETNNSSPVSPLSQTTGQGTRPSRRCAPRTLAEPNLKGKLRSDSGKRRPSSKKR